MALLNEPTLLFGTSGNILPNTTLNHFPNAPSSTSFIVDFSNVLGGYVQIWSISTGVVANSVSGLLINSYSTADNNWYDTFPYGISINIPPIANSVQRQSYNLDTGKYTFFVTNTDPNNNMNVMATTGILV